MVGGSTKKTAAAAASLLELEKVQNRRPKRQLYCTRVTILYYVHGLTVGWPRMENEMKEKKNIVADLVIEDHYLSAGQDQRTID